MANKLSPNLLDELQVQIGPSLEIIADKNGTRFQEYAERWSDTDHQNPDAIVLPVSEEQIKKTAVKPSIPLVTKSGGHSEWSTIGDDGIIIDLSKYSGIKIDAAAKRTVLKGSILSKEVAIALANAGIFTALGNGNTVGAIPYFLGGGVSITTSITKPDLLYAIRGAGQFFGLVTQLTIKATPLSELGNDQRVIWVGAFVFPLERAKDIAPVMKKLTDDRSNATAGLMMVQAPPPARNPALGIAARYTGNPDDAERAYKPLPWCFKRFGVVGLRRFDADGFIKTISIWKSTVAECPDAINTAFNIQWDSRSPKVSGFESAMSLHDTRYWQNNLTRHTDASNRQEVGDFNDRSIAIMRGSDRSEYADFQNGTRTGSSCASEVAAGLRSWER
ncbi:hypothetical protein F4781DRAFT_425595 [Annulohypoxylon bovei var. microspora]|nr:hypothetical protein F4781DRAFT_425595 [Annulohypoxylon bovei var. microspora]